MEIAPYLFWLGLALILAAVTPILGGHLFLLDLTLSAVLLAFLAWLFPGLPPLIQLTIFVGTTLLLIPTVSWTAARFTDALGKGAVAGANDYRGRKAVIVRRGKGIGVLVGGETFPVRVIDEESLKPGERVLVEEFRGITAVVRRLR